MMRGRRWYCAAGNLRHDRGIGDAQQLDPLDPQPRIDDGVDLSVPPAWGPNRVQVGDAAHAISDSYRLFTIYPQGPG